MRQDINAARARVWELAALMRTKRLPELDRWLHPGPRKLTPAEVDEHRKTVAQVADLPLFRRRREAAARRRAAQAETGKGVTADGA